MCSKIKHILLTACCFTGAGLMTSCNDGFMDRFPETSITEKVFFSSPADLETYTNGMYGYIGASYSDTPSDNMLYPEDTDIYKMMRGEYRADNIGKWSWSNIRTVNFMLARTGRVEGDRGEINHYIGLARMFRALVYYSKVKDYSDVPWYSHDLQTTDIDLLYKPQDPRALVVDSIMADLDFAVTHMKTTKSTTRIYRDAALAVQARIALHEGTFRKYHNLGDWEEMLKQSAAASLELIQKGGFSLYKTGSTPYRDLFARLDAPAEEIILGRRYSTELSVLHNSQCNSMTGNQRVSFTKRFVDHYLMADGSRYTDKPGHEKNEFVAEVTGRDPRLSQTILTPGYVQKGTTKEMINTLSKYTLTGYQYIKYVMEPQYDQSNKSPMYFPLFRLAEVYLNYAEAKAELGTLTQDDLDISVNLLRDRAGMGDAHIDMDEANANPDPYLMADVTGYPNVTKSAMTGVILEIRRERTVELCLEGFRLFDMIRWKEGKQLTNEYHGVYFPGEGKYDLNGDGKMETAIYKDQAPSGLGLTKYKLGVDFFLTNDTEGYMWPHKDVKRTWNEERDYLWPIPTDERSLNHSLTQNPGWEDGLSY